MERKIGEIFEFKKDWYQCVEGRCKDCHFSEKRFLCKQFITKDFCTSGIIFKKLEKVGNPYIYNTNGNKGMVKMQEYTLYDTNFCKECDSLMLISSYNPKRISIEIKQNKEDLEEKNNGNTPLNVLTDKYVNGDICYDDFEKEVKALYSCKEEIKPTLKEFDLEAAKSGKPVCTRDGRKARIICFDKKGNRPIVALIENSEGIECVAYYNEKDIDLMMLPEKKEGWVNVYKKSIYKTKEDAFNRRDKENYLMTIKVGWEE